MLDGSDSLIKFTTRSDMWGELSPLLPTLPPTGHVYNDSFMFGEDITYELSIRVCFGNICALLKHFSNRIPSSRGEFSYIIYDVLTLKVE